MELFHPRTPGWEHITDQEVINLLKPEDDTLAWDDKLQILQRDVPFYPEAKLVLAKHPAWQPNNFFFYALLQDGKAFRLDGKSPPIHEFNAKYKLQLQESNVVQYLRFFCFFVRGDEGPFYVAGEADAAYLPDEFRSSDSTDKHAVEFHRLYRKPRLFGQDSAGKWRVSCMVYYSNAVFLADFLVAPGGMCEMKEDNPLMADLPMKIDAPLVHAAVKPTKH